jgi:transposase InsO family protein
MTVAVAPRRKVMPWKKTSPVEEQRRFIERWQMGEVSFVRLCQQFGISPKTGYKRVRRFQVWGWEGLGDLSRAPHQHPNQVAWAVAEQLVEAKRAHLTWGPRKLIAWLRERRSEVPWPAPSTAGGVLQRAGLVRRRRQGRRAAPWGQPFVEATAPNDVWCMDLKGWFQTGNGQRCDPLTVVDAASRYLLVCHALRQPRGPQVQQVVERAFREYGLPRAIRTDNGPPFASTGLGGLSQLAVWWIKLGIVPERIEPGHPEQNGRLERLHRTLKAETVSPPQATLHAQQRSFDAFRTHYNQERPHEALGQRPPASHYAPSLRTYPRRVPEPEYESGVLVRRVRTNGEIKWRGGTLYVSEVLRGEPIGLVQQDDRFWAVRFGPLQIGLLDELACSVFHTPTLVLPMCPV